MMYTFNHIINTTLFLINLLLCFQMFGHIDGVFYQHLMERYRNSESSSEFQSDIADIQEIRKFYLHF